jgi:crossover junction endodeoxyribonuclease RuvC
MNILGIDNGLSGALAFYDGMELLIHDMPNFEINKRKALDVQEIKKIILNNRPTHCFIEQLTPMPKISGLTAFSMGHSEGVFMGILGAYNIPFTLVRPAVWKKAMQCPADKDGARMRANQLLPQFKDNWPLKKHDGRAESALIALYGAQRC